MKSREVGISLIELVIALAIIAEVLSALRERPGTPLRHREGPIHR